MANTDDNIPLPTSVRTISTGETRIKLGLDKLVSECPVDWVVYASRAESVDDSQAESTNSTMEEEETIKWEHTYHCTQPECDCTDLDPQTRYTFKICSVHNGKYRGVLYSAETGKPSKGGVGGIVAALGVVLCILVVVAFGFMRYKRKEPPQTKKKEK